MNNKPVIYLELLFRSTDTDFKPSWGRPDAAPVYLPVKYAWQEDPNDLHIQMCESYGGSGENLNPRQDAESGDYIVPASPWLLRHLRKCFDPVVIPGFKFGHDTPKHDGLLVYHLGWCAGLSEECGEGGAIAPYTYIKVLEKFWAL